MGVGSSNKKVEEKAPLIPKKTNKENNNIEYFPYILRIHSDLNTIEIELKTETENPISLDIKYFLNKFAHNNDKDYSCHLCGKNNENKIDYCNQCKKYICQNCKYCDNNNKSSLNHFNFRIIYYKSIYTCLTHKKRQI